MAVQFNHAVRRDEHEERGQEDEPGVDRVQLLHVQGVGSLGAGVALQRLKILLFNCKDRIIEVNWRTSSGGERRALTCIPTVKIEKKENLPGTIQKNSVATELAIKDGRKG